MFDHEYIIKRAVILGLICMAAGFGLGFLFGMDHPSRSGIWRDDFLEAVYTEGYNAGNGEEEINNLKQALRTCTHALVRKEDR
jgi:hypothetical protein